MELQSAASGCNIYLGNGDWVIPKNVTVNAYKSVGMGAPTGQSITINGTWNCMNNLATLGNVGTTTNEGETIFYGSVTVNGTMSIAKDVRVAPVVADSFTLNGTLNNAGTCYLYSNMTITETGQVVDIPNPALVNSVRELYLTSQTSQDSIGGSITGPSSGTAAIGGQITAASNNTLSGNLSVDQITMYNGDTLTIAEGADVTVTKLTCNGTSSSSAAINVNGRLSVTTNGYNTVSYTTITLGENGVLALMPKVQFGGEVAEYNSTITGTGTLELYGIMKEWTYNDRTYTSITSAPSVFGVYSHQKDYDTGEYLTLTGVDGTVTVKRMWDQCTTHTWGEAAIVEPTCGDRGYTTKICAVCGTELRSDYTDATGDHTLSYAAWTNPTNGATVKCSVCGHSGTVFISATNGVYNDGKPVETATLEWPQNLMDEGDVPAIQYANNTQVGTATASATFGDVTIFTTFEIVACDHSGGTATCTEQAICEKCGNPYGDLLPHTEGTAATCQHKAVCSVCGEEYGELAYHDYVLKYDADSHWVECSVCGLDCLGDYGLEVTSHEQISDEVLLEMIRAYFETTGEQTQNQAIYLERYGNTPSVHAYANEDGTGGCLLCGYTACSSHNVVVDPAVAATCTTAGKTEGSHCSVCGAVITAQETVNALDHDYKSVVTDPTCTEKGYTTHTCTRCGDSYKDTETDALGHAWDEGKITTQPTETKEGVKTYTCTRCGETREEAVSMLAKQDVRFPASSYSGTYGGADMYNTATNLTTDGGSLIYSSADTSVATVDKTSGKVTIMGTGTTTITATAAAVSGKYIETTASYTLTINKAPLTITANDKTIAYGEEASDDGFTATGFQKNEDASVLSGEAVYSCSYTRFGAVGYYPITVSGLTSDNYEITFANGTLTVDKAAGYTLTLGDLEQLAGHVSGVSVQVEPYDASAQFSVEYLVGDVWSAEVPQAVGEYSVRAALTSSTNIEIAGEPIYTTLTVKSGVTVDTGSGLEDVDVSVEVSGSSAEITVTQEDLEQIAANADGEVSIDLGSVSDVDELVLPGTLVTELSRSEKTDSLTVTTEDASVTLSAPVLDTVAAAITSDGDKVTVRMESVAADGLNEAQQNAVKSITTDYPVTVVNVSLVVTHSDGSEEIISDLGGDVEITVPYDELPTVADGQYVVACYIADDGTVTYLFAVADEANRTITFTTNHFSTYAVFISAKPSVAVIVNGGSGSGVYLADDTVTIKADSRSGYTFAGWEIVSGSMELADARAAETTFIMPAEAVELNATYRKNSSGGGSSGGGGSAGSGKEDPVEISFVDVAEDAYYHDAVLWAVENKVTSGTSATTFSPNMTCTRAQAVTFLWRAAGSPVPKSAEMPFADVAADAYYRDAVLWAVEQGITTGTSETTFSPNATCTRSQIVTFLWRSEKSPAAETVNPFTDVTADAYYNDAVIWAVANGVTDGTSAVTFSPNADCTRAQIVTFLWRYKA